MEVHHSSDYESIVKPMISQIRGTDSAISLPLISDRSIFLTKLIADIIMHNFLPLSIVESPFLQAILHELEPSYVIPKRRYFMGNVFHEIYSQVKQNIYHALQLASDLSLGIQ